MSTWGSDAPAPSEDAPTEPLEPTPEQLASIQSIERSPKRHKTMNALAVAGLTNFVTVPASSENDANEMLRLYDLQKNPDRLMLRAGYFVAVRRHPA